MTTETPFDPPICKDCTYFNKEFPSEYICTSSRIPFTRDPVTGVHYPLQVSCAAIRTKTDPSWCGPEGRWFKARASRPSLFHRFLNLLGVRK